MILLALLLGLGPPQQSTAVMAVRARVAQTCLVTTTRVTCRGAAGRPQQARIIPGGEATPQQLQNLPGAQMRSRQARIRPAGYITVVEF